jgi:hypothetical protein
MRIYPILATDYTGARELIVGAAVVVLLVALISLKPARRGHWSSLLLSVPTTLIGVSSTLGLYRDGWLWLMMIFAVVPVIGITSMVIWLDAWAKRR